MTLEPEIHVNYAEIRRSVEGTANFLFRESSARTLEKLGISLEHDDGSRAC